MTIPGRTQGTRAGRRQSWLAGLALGLPTGFLTLEFPLAGLGLFVATLAVVARTGRAAAGLAGLVVGLGGTWFVLFGRVALTCGPTVADGGGCEAPSIGGAVLASLLTLAAGGIASALIAARARRA